MRLAGLYDELRDLHSLIHEYQQLDEGAVQQATAEQIRQKAVDAKMLADLGWDDARMRAEPQRFMQALHDHLHEMAQASVPLGLHTFGEPAQPEHRLATVMQQLGQPFLLALGLAEDEPIAEDFAGLQASLPYRTLQRFLRDGERLETIDDGRLREQLERALELDAQLAETGELRVARRTCGGFVAPGPGGDPVRNPGVPSGRNLYAFEADKLPTRAAYEAGAEAFGATASKATARIMKASRQKSSPSACGRPRRCAIWASSKARFYTHWAYVPSGTQVGACRRWR